MIAASRRLFVVCHQNGVEARVQRALVEAARKALAGTEGAVV